MSLSLLRKGIVREGYLKKAASAKGKDVVRKKKWQDRWFVLKGKSLNYFKKRGDGTPKGTIDMRDAHVESADEKTGVDFSIRIAQTKQVFHYLQAGSASERDGWLSVLREAAGLEDSKQAASAEFGAALPACQMDALCSHSVMHAAKPGQEPEHVVLVCDLANKSLKIFKRDELVRVHPAATISRVEHGDQPSFKHCYSLSVHFKALNYLAKREFFVGTLLEAQLLTSILGQMGQNNFHTVNLTLHRPPISTGSMQVRDFKELGQWHEFWVVLCEFRCLFFEKKESTLPCRVVFVNQATVRRDGKLGITIISGPYTTFLRLQNENTRDYWYANFEKTASVQTAGMMVASSANARAVSGPQIKVLMSRFGGFNLFSSELSAGCDSFVVSWGIGSEGQLGHRNKDSFYTPEVVSTLHTRRVRGVSAGEKHCGAVTEAGQVYMWGEGERGQLGLGPRRLQSSSPYLLVSLRTTPIQQLSCGRSHALAVTTMGEVWGWGAGKHGQLGGTEDAFEPIHIATAGKAKFVVCGGDHSGLVDSTNALRAWGRNDHGQVGLGTRGDVTTPTVLQSLGTNVKQVSFGADCSAAVCGRKLFTWGNNASGQLGHGDRRERLQPEEVSFFENTKVEVVSLGTSHGCAIAHDGTQSHCFTWGQPPHNCLDHEQLFPGPIPPLSSVPVNHFSSSQSHTLAVTPEGELFSFGQNSNAELGNGVAQINGVKGAREGAHMLVGLFHVKLVEGTKVVQVAAGKGFSVMLCEGKAPETVFAGRAQPLMETHCSAKEPSAEEKITELMTSVAVEDKPQLAPQLQTKLDVKHCAHPECALPVLPAKPFCAMHCHQADEQQQKPKKEKHHRKKTKGHWKEAVDPNTKRTYYYHTKTRETRWVKPPEMA